MSFPEGFPTEHTHLNQGWKNQNDSENIKTKQICNTNYTHNFNSCNKLLYC